MKRTEFIELTRVINQFKEENKCGPLVIIQAKVVCIGFIDVYDYERGQIVVNYYNFREDVADSFDQILFFQCSKYKQGEIIHFEEIRHVKILSYDNLSQLLLAYIAHNDNIKRNHERMSSITNSIFKFR